MATHRGQNNTRRRNRQRGSGQNSTTLSLKEYYGEITTGMTAINLAPKYTRLTKLSNMAPNYEQYKLVSFVVHIVNEASQASGTYFAGVCYGRKPPTDGKGVAALSPSICKPITQSGSISVPCAKVMGQPWLHTSDSSPGSVQIYTSSTEKLQVWISYNVKFSGPTDVKQGVDTFYTYDTRSWRDESGNVVTTLASEEDLYGELEVAVQDETALTTAWDTMVRTFRTFIQLHRAYTQGVGVVHFIVDAFTSLALPRLANAAILHVQQRPFRASSELWRQLGVEPVTRVGPTAGSRDSGLGANGRGTRESAGRGSNPAGAR